MRRINLTERELEIVGIALIELDTHCFTPSQLDNWRKALKELFFTVHDDCTIIDPFTGES
jgi:hypothetical protein